MFRGKIDGKAESVCGTFSRLFQRQITRDAAGDDQCFRLESGREFFQRADESFDDRRLKARREIFYHLRRLFADIQRLDLIFPDVTCDRRL